MSIIIFLIILAILVFVHELGHYLAAKGSNVRVDEFAVGFPPKIYSKKVGETKYSLNIIPFGGYVKIHGENPDEESISGADKERSLVNKPKYIQAMVLFAGIFFNIVFAWLLLTGGLLSGLPMSVEGVNPKYVENARVVLLGILEGSPAERAGLQKGDAIAGQNSISSIQETIRNSDGAPVQFTIIRDEEIKEVVVQPERADEQSPYQAGIAMAEIGLYKVPFYLAPYEGIKLTAKSIKDISIGLGNFFGNIFKGEADFSQVTGPVGIVGLVGEAQTFGFVYLLSFTALISLNLALINLVPFPALDGGRLLFVLIEAIKGSRIKPQIANSLNALGFLLLILLMLVITYKDITKIIK
jgi:regulator of sigma E protease